MEWPAWLKCSETGGAELLVIRIKRRCSPKRSLS